MAEKEGRIKSNGAGTRASPVLLIAHGAHAAFAQERP